MLINIYITSAMVNHSLLYNNGNVKLVVRPAVSIKMTLIKLRYSIFY